jgi:hypothetical protein
VPGGRSVRRSWSVLFNKRWSLGSRVCLKNVRDGACGSGRTEPRAVDSGVGAIVNVLACVSMREQHRGSPRTAAVTLNRSVAHQGMKLETLSVRGSFERAF